MEPSSEHHQSIKVEALQLRILQLRHASKCLIEKNCPNSKTCAIMKELWRHILICKHSDCERNHCLSSRLVLSHYSKCNFFGCQICVPVRKTIFLHDQKILKRMSTTSQSNLNASIQSKDVPLNEVENNINFSSNREQDHSPPRKVPRIEPQRDEALTSNFDDSEPRTTPTMGLGVAHNTLSTQRQSQSQSQSPCQNQSSDDLKDSVVPPVTSPALPIASSVSQQVPPPSIYPLDPISCGMYCFTDEEIKNHVSEIEESFRLNSAKIKETCQLVIRAVLSCSQGAPPVDASFIDLLGIVRKRVESESYRDIHCFVTDAHRVFDNAMRGDRQLQAKSMKRELDFQVKKIMDEIHDASAKLRCDPNVCYICGEGDLNLEPPVYYCHGPCKEKIRRNARFYCNDAKTQHWCSNCCRKDAQPGGMVEKLNMKEVTHIENAKEEWVECDGGCGRFVHQVCSLFNSRRNTDDLPFVCPYCLQEQRKKFPDQVAVAPTWKKTKACDLPHCTMSKFLEDRVRRRLEIAYEEEAVRLAIPLDDVQKCPSLFLRQVSCIDKTHQVRAGMYERYKGNGYPAEFPCRTKCLLLFQTIDGQDVLLFGMYVCEYGQNCPKPNQGRVYISYLDSVHYLRPSQYRTMIYQEILISYLDYVKARGFHTAHIWACPPHKGDDYLFYTHPPAQKVPKPQSLCAWYSNLLQRGKERGVVTRVADIHSEFFSDHSNDATVLPYFEGDYWVNEAEVIIGEMKKSHDRKNPHASSCSTAATVQARDPVMIKLSKIIAPMKSSFIVVKLQPPGNHLPKRLLPSLKIESSTAPTAGCIATSDMNSVDGTGSVVVGGDTSGPMEVSQSSSTSFPSSEVTKAEPMVVPEKRKRRIMCGEGMPNFNSATEDVDDVQESEHFDVRESFLSLCQGNRYQFDQLRRAKHSSMMVLYHLHNPDAPKFLHRCSHCHVDILGGSRYHCESCVMDFCGGCLKANGKGIHPSPCHLQLIAPSSSPTAAPLTPEENKARKQSICLHLKLLQHATGCRDCSSAECGKMKEHLQHDRTCKVRATGGCSRCAKLSNLFKVHAKTCRLDGCRVPYCEKLKQRLRQLALQQQRMDDSRRMNMNNEYNRQP